MVRPPKITDEQIIEAAVSYGRVLEVLSEKKSLRDKLFVKMLAARSRAEDMFKRAARERGG